MISFRFQLLQAGELNCRLYVHILLLQIFDLLAQSSNNGSQGVIGGSWLITSIVGCGRFELGIFVIEEQLIETFVLFLEDGDACLQLDVFIRHQVVALCVGEGIQKLG